MDVFCPNNCFDSWTVYDHIRGETGEDGQYLYNVGAWFLAAGIISGVLALTICACLPVE